MAQAANSINSTIGASNSGATNTLTITNPSNTATSKALVNVTVGGSTADDAFATYTVTGVTNWSQGVDNSITGDPFVLAASTALGTTNVMSAATSGAINYPLQPCFLVEPTGNATNATGDGTVYDIVLATTAFDQGSNFSTPNFTAPVTGKYLFCINVTLANLGVAHTEAFINLVTTTNTYQLSTINSATARELVSGNTTLTLTASLVVAMTATNTAKIQAVVSGSTKTVTVVSANFTTFSGLLMA